MPKRLIALVTLLSGLATIHLISGAWVAFELPALGFMGIGTGLCLALCAIAVRQKRQEVRILLPVLSVVAAGALAYILFLTPTRESGVGHLISRVLTATWSFIALAVASALIFRSRQAKDYFLASR